MADYAKSTLSSKYSEESDYSDGPLGLGLVNQSFSKSYTTATERIVFEGQVLNSVSTTIELGSFSSILAMAIFNEDASEYVTVTQKAAGNSSTSFSYRVAAGDFVRMTDVTVSADLVLQAQTTDAKVRVVIFGL